MATAPTFEIANLTETDLPAFAELHGACFTSGISTVLYRDAAVRDTAAWQAHVAEGVRMQLHGDPDSRWLKAVDTAGHVAGIANWKLHLKPRAPAQVTTDNAYAPNSATAAFAPAIRLDAWADFFGGLSRNRTERIGGRPHFFLSILVVHPRAQSRGVGRMLVQWGIERADGAGLPIFVESSAAGMHLYPKLGFERQGQLEFDLTKYGCEGSDIQELLVRWPRGGGGAVSEDGEGPGGLGIEEAVGA